MIHLLRLMLNSGYGYSQVVFQLKDVDFTAKVSLVHLGKDALD